MHDEVHSLHQNSSATSKFGFKEQRSMALTGECYYSISALLSSPSKIEGGWQDSHLLC